LPTEKELEDLVYIISHDLKEPLRMINSYIQLIAKKYITTLDGDAKDYFNYVIDGTKRLQMMIDDLASYSKILRNDYKYEVVDLNTIANKVKETVIKLHKDVNLVINIEKLPSCYCYPDLFEILLMHLINNALKFNSNTPCVNIRCVKKRSKLTFEIEDNGIGIDGQFYKEIFRVFRKLHTNKEYPGSGIGLAICKKIVEKHGGKIWFTSSKTKGTIFFFTLMNNKHIN
jgi:light-regulated signal transduction histidine kinase (bacteriophytochrome)